jgi:hypothetical protein
MVAVIKAGSSLRRPFHYNENKVADGVANRILVENFPLSIDQLNAEDSLRFLIKTVTMRLSHRKRDSWPMNIPSTCLLFIS